MTISKEIKNIQKEIKELLVVKDINRIAISFSFKEESNQWIAVPIFESKSSQGNPLYILDCLSRFPPKPLEGYGRDLVAALNELKKILKETKENQIFLGEW